MHLGTAPVYYHNKSTLRLFCRGFKCSPTNFKRLGCIQCLHNKLMSFKISAQVYTSNHTYIHISPKPCPAMNIFKFYIWF